MKYFFAGLLAACAAALSVVMIRSPVNTNPLDVLLFPGFVIAIITSGNVHAFRTWVVALGNFAFYFGVVCLAWKIWERLTRTVAGGRQ